MDRRAPRPLATPFGPPRRLSRRNQGRRLMLTIYGHPISSYTWKVLIALHENGTPFDYVTVDQNTYADFVAKWPLGKFPILIDSDRKTMTTETSVIIEYLD